MSFVYGRGAHAMTVGAQATNPVAWLTNAMIVGLSTSTHVPNKDDQFLDDVGADDFVDGELTGSPRQTISAGKTVTYDAANDRVEIDGDNVTYTAINAGIAAQATIFDNVGGSDAARRLVCSVNTGGFPFTTNGTDLTLAWNAQGIMQLTV